MEIGAGIGVAGLAVSAAAVVITAIKVKATDKQDSNSNAGKSCPLHSGIEATLAYLKNSMDTVQEDIKDILQKLGG